MLDDTMKKQSKYPELLGLTGAEYRRAWNRLHADKMREVSKRFYDSHPGLRQQLSRKCHKKHMHEFGMARTSRINIKFKAKATMSYKRWSPVDDDMLVSSGMTYAQLAELLGRSLRSIMNRKHKIMRVERGLN